MKLPVLVVQLRISVWAVEVVPVKWNSTRAENRLLMKICAVAANGR